MGCQQQWNMRDLSMHWLGGLEGLVAVLTGDGLLCGVVRWVVGVFVIIMCGKAVANPAADVREEKSRRWVADWKLDEVDQSMHWL